MRKTILLTILIVLLLPTVAMGYGISNDTMWTEYPDAIDFRKFRIAKDMDSLSRPKTGFEIEVVSPNGSSKQMSTGIPNTEYISADFDNNEIDAVVGNKLVINERSMRGSGSRITQYDIQYRFTPASAVEEGKTREDFEINSAIVNSWSRVKGIIEKIELSEPGELEIYLAVADNAACLPGAINWSVNGNVRSLNTSNPKFPGGIFWYFSGLTVKLSGQVPDFYPTPEGSSEWQPSFKECAKTYTGKPGDQITFPVNLYNIGTKASTDYRAVWDGQGKDPSTGWKGDNAPFVATGTTEDGEETDLITLDKDEFKTFDVTVTVPEQTSKLYFLANVNGETPKAEQVKENNSMVIIIEPEGIDLAMSSPKIMQEGALKGQKAIVTVPLTSFRNDTKDKPVEGEINWQWTQADGVTVIESGSKTVTLSPGDQDRITVTVTGYPGDTFWVIGEIMPTTDHDIDLSNNITKTKVYITLKKPPATPPATKEDPSPGTRVNLRD